MDKTDSEKKRADVKVIILGDSNVGKTTLIHRYLDRCFQETVTTIGASFFLKRWGSYNVAIWDTAGEEKYSGLSSFYCRGAKAAILAFDLNSEESFDVLRKRYIPLVDAAEPGCLMVVVGTKLDLVRGEERAVSTESGLEMAGELNHKLKPGQEVPYYETSSKDGRNVDRVFQYIFHYLLPLGDEGVARGVRAAREARGVVQLDGRYTPRAKPAGTCCS